MTGIDQLQETVSSGGMLYQNYPDPFYLTTAIIYDLFQDEYVTLKVYDQLGSKIADLVNVYQAAGTYKISFNALDLPNGFYYYRLNAGNTMQTRKMVRYER